MFKILESCGNGSMPNDPCPCGICQNGLACRSNVCSYDTFSLLNND
jgi:hypothetical protein